MAFCYSGDRHKQPDEEDCKQQKTTDQDLNTDRNDQIVQMINLYTNAVTQPSHCTLKFVLGKYW